MRPVAIKQRLSLIVLGVNIGVFVWHRIAPDILVSLTIWSLLYLALLFSLVVLVTVVGWFGASLTFPVEK